MRFYFAQNQGVESLVNAVDTLAPDMGQAVSSGLALAFVGVGAFVAYRLIRKMMLSDTESPWGSGGGGGYDPVAYGAPIGPGHDSDEGKVQTSAGGNEYFISYDDFDPESMAQYEYEADSQTETARQALENYSGETDNQDDPIPDYPPLDPADPFKQRKDDPIPF